MLSIEPFHLCCAIVFFANEDGLRVVSECVNQHVRMSGYDELGPAGCFHQQISEFGQDVGVQTKFRLLDSDQRRRLRIAQNGEQAQIAQRAIGKTRGRDAEIALGEEDLYRSALDAEVKIV